MEEMTLLEETIGVLREWGRAPGDVLWCSIPVQGWFTWEDFKELANEGYDSGYGTQKVSEDLLIVGEDFWLERHEYDGSEWWEYKTLPAKPGIYEKPEKIIIKERQQDDN